MKSKSHLPPSTDKTVNTRRLIPSTIKRAAVDIWSFFIFLNNFGISAKMIRVYDLTKVTSKSKEREREREREKERKKERDREREKERERHTHTHTHRDREKVLEEREKQIWLKEKLD